MKKVINAKKKPFIQQAVLKVRNIHNSADNYLPILRIKKCYFSFSRMIWPQSSNLISFLPTYMHSMSWNIPIFLTMIPLSSSTWAWVSITLSRPLFSEWCFYKKIWFNLWYPDIIHNMKTKRGGMTLRKATTQVQEEMSLHSKLLPDLGKKYTKA